MEVIGHDHKGIQDNGSEMVRNVVPTPSNSFTDSAELCLSFDDFSEKALAIPAADGHEVGPGLGIVEGRNSQVLSAIHIDLSLTSSNVLSVSAPVAGTHNRAVLLQWNNNQWTLELDLPNQLFG